MRYDRPGTGLSDRDVPPRTPACEVPLLATLAPPAIQASGRMAAIVAGASAKARHDGPDK